MPMSINPIFPVIAAQGGAPDAALQPGTVIDAQVLKMLGSDLVQIAIANLSIEVFSEIPLQVGQSLQLAVSQTPQGIKLAVIGQSPGSPGVAPSAGVGATAADVASPGPAPLAPEITLSVAAKPGAGVAAPKNPLTPLQALAISAASQTAAARQGSLAPLFANLSVVAVSDAFAPKLQQAIAPLLALRPNLDQNLTGNDVKAAFESSGLFLEASLASGQLTPSQGGVPDLKAALIVLRQTLLSLGSPAESVSAPAQAFQPQALVAAQLLADIPAPERQTAASPAFAPSLNPEIDVEEVFLPQARLPVAEDFAEVSGPFLQAPPQSGTASRATTAGTTLNLLQEALQNIPQQAGAAKLVLNQDAPFDPMLFANGPQRTPRNDSVGAAHTAAPPPPFRGALPVAQPVAPPSLAPDTPLATTLHRLLDDTEVAIARQTLLQVASLPDRVDIAGARTDPAAPRWNFEIPFATPVGTAIAQFEISREGTGRETDAAKRVWRARFSLDVEPAGPIHALISLTGGKTSVRMWAERPVTATQLRAGASGLSQALISAELQPGDIVIRDGMPAQSRLPPAGHFLDRAL